MNVSPSDLQFCLSQADIIAHHYTLHSRDSSNPVRSIGELLQTYEQALGATVQVYEVNIPKDDAWVWGMCILSADRNIEVALAKDLNECWGRFVLCKELFHQTLDRAEYRNISIAGHIEEYTLAFPDDDCKPRKPVVAEFLAEVGAMELLFPYGKRVKILDSNPRPDFLEIATRFMVPKAHTQKYLSQSYMESLGRFSRI